MAKTHIDKSIVINAPIEKVYEIIGDFHHWNRWSPWLIMDEKAKVNVREDGKYYEWDGEFVGSGNMTITSEEANKVVHIDLLFLKPWKSKSKVTFQLKQEGDAVRLHWIMDGSLPFFMFWMKKMMEAFVGMDFERGLMMAKDVAELGDIQAKMTIEGMDNFKGCSYIGIQNEATMDDLGPLMEANYSKLMTYIMDGRQENMDGNPFTIYHKWDMINRKVKFTSCIPVHKQPTDAPEGTIAGSVPATKVHVIHQKGPYRYIGNVWSAQHNRMRSKVFKNQKSIHPMEVYLNSPKDTAENDLESRVLFPAK